MQQGADPAEREGLNVPPVNDFLRRMAAEAAAKRADQLVRLGLRPGVGVILKCSECDTPFWVRIPLVWRYEMDQALCFACVAACAGGLSVETFDRSSISEAPPLHFDLHATCRRCSTEYAAPGAVIRCPGCAIETAREVFGEVVLEVRTAAATGASLPRKELEALLSRLVSCFDGVMRWMCSVAIRNVEAYAKYRVSAPDPTKATWQPRCDPDTDIPALRGIVSFQDIRKLRRSGVVSASDKQWETMTLCFAKRHLIIHKLGVADAQYIARSGDRLAQHGRLVSLTIDELMECADACDDLVKRFFGLWLS